MKELPRVNRYDKIFGCVVKPNITPEELYTRAKGWTHNPENKEWPADQAALQALSTNEALRVADDYLIRNPPSIDAQHPIFRTFYSDECPQGSAIYDGQPGEYTACFEGGAVVWKARHPLNRRSGASQTFNSLDTIPRALIQLAIGLKRAFKIPEANLQACTLRYGLVLRPKGDSRTIHLADAGNSLEVEGLYNGTALLFESSGVTDNGRITILKTGWPARIEGYSLSVWGQFYAIEIDGPSFERNPHIPI